MGAPQGKDRAGQEHRLHASHAQLAEDLFVHRLQMVGGSCAEFGSQSRARSRTELLGMNAQSQTVAAGGCQHRARFLHREGVIVAEDVAIPRQTGRSNLGKQLFGDPANVLFAMVRKLRRNCMRRQ